MKSKIDKKICLKVRSTLERIYPKPTQGMFNFRCYENSVQYAFNSKKDTSVCEVIYIDDGNPVLHYLCRKGDDYHEVSIGWRADYVEYYLIREIPKTEWIYIGHIFNQSLEYWLISNTSWFERNILRIDRVV